MQTSQQSDKQIAQLSPENVEPATSSTKVQKVSSQFQNEYRNATTPYSITAEEKQKFQLQLLKKGNIEFDSRYFQTKFTSELVDSTPNFQAMLFRLSFGYFKMLVSLLNVDSISQCHNFPYIHQKPNSSVFLYVDKQGKKHSIKCFRIQPTAFAQHLNFILRQVCFMKIAAGLEVGHEVNNLLGFDIIVYNNCAEFAMEYCTKVDKITHFDKQLLCKKLSRMHAFNLVHLDIKPNNIMCSPTLNEIVLIDFGLSKHIKQEIGFKSKTKFSGSLMYCSNQMRKAYLSQKFQCVDLYHNDLVCLNASLLQLESEKSCADLEPMEQVEDYAQSELQVIIMLHYSQHFKKAGFYFSLVQLKYHIFRRQQFQTTLLNTQQFINKHYSQLIDFAKLIRLFPNSRYIRYIRNLFYQFQLRNRLHYACFDMSFLFQLMPPNKPEELQQNQQESHFAKVFKSLMDNSQQVGEQDTQLLAFVSKGNNRLSWLLNEEVINQQENINYLIKCYANFVDFTATASSFQQKRTASELIAKRLSISVQAEQQDQAYLSSCQKALLLMLAQTKPPFSDEVIPILLRNLLILNGVTFEQIGNLFKVVFEGVVDSLYKFKLKIKLQLVLLLLEHEGYLSYNYTTVEDFIQQLLSIKVQEPFDNILKQIGTKFLQSMFKNYKQIEALIKNIVKDLYLAENFTDELIIWQLSYLKLDNGLEAKHYQLFYWLKLQLIYAYSIKYNISFDFYYFPLMYFPNQYLKQKITKMIYLNMRKCLQKEEILKRFAIYYYYWRKVLASQTFQIKFLHYSQIANELVARYQLQQKKHKTVVNLNFLMDKKEHQILSNVFYFYVSYLQRQESKIIAAQLQKIVAHNTLRQIIFELSRLTVEQKNSFFNNSAGSLVFSVICFIYQNIYSQCSFLVQQISYFCEEVEKALSSISFSARLTLLHYEYSLLTSKIKTLELQEQSQGVITAYEQFIVRNLKQEAQKFINSDFFNRPFLMYVRRSVQLKAQQQGVEALRFYFQTVMKYKRFKTLFALQTFQTSCYYLNYYAIFYQPIDQFLALHINLCKFLQQFPYDNYVTDYIKSFSYLSRAQFQSFLQDCWQYLNHQSKTYLYLPNCYISILYSFLLILNNRRPAQRRRWTKFNTKMLVCIVRRVSKMSLRAKYFVLGHIYLFLYNLDPTKMYYNRRYLKFKTEDISFPQFRKAARFPPKSPNNSTTFRSHSPFVTPILAKLSRWHKCTNK